MYTASKIDHWCCGVRALRGRVSVCCLIPALLGVAVTIGVGCGNSDSSDRSIADGGATLPTKSQPEIPGDSVLGRTVKAQQSVTRGSFWRDELEKVLSGWGGARQPMTDALRATYQKRDYRPLFLDGLWPNDAATVMVTAIREIPSHGLKHSRYRPKALIPLFESLALDPSAAEGTLTPTTGDLDRLAKLESELPRTIYKRARRDEKHPEIRYRPLNDLPEIEPVDGTLRCLLEATQEIVEGGHFEPDELASRCDTEVSKLKTGLQAARDHIEARQEHKASLALLDALLLQAFYQWVLDFSIDVRVHPFESNGPTNRERLPGEAKTRLLATIDDLADGPTLAKALKASIPRTPSYGHARRALARYTKLEDQGDYVEVDIRGQLEKGDQSDAVRALQKRLAAEGYYDGPIDGDFGDSLHDAVVAYQRTHDLADGGIVGENTVESLNTPFDWRLKQIISALAHFRESSINRNREKSAGLHVRVNLPSQELEVRQGTKVLRTHKVIIGSNLRVEDPVNDVTWHARRTKLFDTVINEIVLNPTWIVPQGIVIDEIQPKIRANPNYMEENNFSKVNDLLVQGPAESNPLGQVKFSLESTDSIYLHDTDKRWLFDEHRRDLSHGCIRVHEPEKLAAFFLEKQGIDAKTIHSRIEAGSTYPIKLEDPIPIFIEYNTLGFTDDGDPIFYRDVYYYDIAYWKKRTPITRRFP